MEEVKDSSINSMYLKFKIGEKCVKELILDYTAEPIGKIAYKLSEKYKIPYTKMLEITEFQYKRQLDKKRIDSNRITKDEIKIGNDHEEEKYIYTNDSISGNRIGEHVDLETREVQNNSELKENLAFSSVNMKLNSTKASKREGKETKKTFSKTVGDHVYQKSLVELEKRKKNTERIKNEMQENEMKECKVKPEKTEYSTFLNFKLHFNLLPKDAIDTVRKMKTRSLEKGPKSGSNSNEYGSFSYTNLNGDFADMPSTTKTKKVKSPAEVDKISDRLYRQWEFYSHKKEKLKNEYYSDVCPFKPKINPPTPIAEQEPTIKETEINHVVTTETDNHNVTKSSDLLNKVSFLERVTQWKSRVSQKIQDQLEKAAKVDLTTGEAFHNPSAYRLPSSDTIIYKFKNDNDFKGEIHERLYRENETLKMKKTALVEEHFKETAKMMTTVKADPKSKELAEVNKAHLFEELYLLLNPNELRSVTFTKEYIDELSLDQKASSQLLKVIQIFGESKQGYTHKEFIEKIEDVYHSKLNYGERTRVNDWYNFKIKVLSPKKARQDKAKQESLHSFKPVVTQSSLDVLAKGKKYAGTSFAERNKSLLEKKEAFISEKKTEHDQKMMKDCSFHPNTKKESLSPTKSMNINIKTEAHDENELPIHVENQESSKDN